MQQLSKHRSCLVSESEPYADWITELVSRVNAIHLNDAGLA